MSAFLSCLVILASIGSLVAEKHQTPVFAGNYHVRGLLSLPYAELNEPFSAWYDKETQRSRTDYYGDLYKIYQFGPKSGDKVKHSSYGTMYKQVWVPSTFHFDDETVNASMSSIEKAHYSLNKVKTENSNDSENGLTRRVCFQVDGGVGFTISAQSVLPDLNSFKFDSEGLCPHVASQTHRRRKCELWKLINEEGDKKNTYKFWLSRDEKTGEPIPVHYYMLGYDRLLGSHYDRYDISYFGFKSGAALDEDFQFDASGNKCRGMPGPGDEAKDGAKRSHMIVANPIHEFVAEPHRYDHIDHEFDSFTDDHDKSYPSGHHERKGWHNFLHNFRFINAKNRELKQYKLKVNRFADSNQQELAYLRGRLRSSGYNGGLDYATHHPQLTSGSSRSLSAIPPSFDWTIRGAVTPVKDQAVCGSCWSFGTTGTLEGAYFVKTGKLVKFSQQQLVDCSWEFGNNGCDGGEDFRAYGYIMKAGGLASEEDYGHYMGVDGKCHENKVSKAVKISGFYNVTRGDSQALKHALVTYGPVTVAIDASRPTFTFYSHGVYYDNKCNNSPDGLDHQVLVTGYAELDGQPVWQVKNSWSTYWGDDGYIMMAHKDNNCGVMDSPTVPIIEL